VPHRRTRRIHHHRYGAAPTECRGVIGHHDRRAEFVTIWASTEVVRAIGSKA
jgi:hypothetical protein